jgi:GrpB-like predicted nucleotidyltransferase (UPF0157 family)
MRQVIVVPYNSEWLQMYHEEASHLKAFLRDEIVAIHHIGSTSIPGMSAKPIIDILIEVHNIDRIDEFNERFIQSGYLPRGEAGIAGRRFVIKGNEEDRSCHIHIFPLGHQDITRHLVFRDYLISHPQDAQRYSSIKQELAALFPTDIESYMDGKDGLIKELEQKALDWHQKER